MESKWNLENILITSISNPIETWKSYESVRALKFRIRISDLLLINSLHFDKLKKFENDFNSINSKKYYLNYWNNHIDFYEKISANKIGLDPKTKKPNTSKVIDYLKDL